MKHWMMKLGVVLATASMLAVPVAALAAGGPPNGRDKGNGNGPSRRLKPAPQELTQASDRKEARERKQGMEYGAGPPDKTIPTFRVTMDNMQAALPSSSKPDTRYSSLPIITRRFGRRVIRTSKRQSD
ncbi:MAG: hypothetical protein JXA21_14850 [Anaerolineae bacterium]|nr:hypothetical protein [Anaerolineae bacterium]